MNTTNKKSDNFDDFLPVDMQQQQEANKDVTRKKTSRKNDPKYYRPRLLKKEVGEGKKAIYDGDYQSIIRLLPQKGWVQDPSIPFSVIQHMHYIQEKKQGGVFLYIKCRKTLGPNKKCPICDANWAVWRKATEMKDEVTLKIAKSRIAKATAICNVLVVTDINNPDLNGEIKLWEHTIPVNEKLLAPLRAGKSSKEEPEQPQKRGFKKEPAEEKVDFFVPFHPIKGRDRFLIIEPQKDNPTIVSYNGSYWEDEPSVLGWYEKGTNPDTGKKIVPATREEIMAILERTYSLKEFIDDVPSVEKMLQQLAEYNQKAMDMGAQPLTETPSGFRPPLTPPRQDSGANAAFFNVGLSGDDVPVDPETGNEEGHESTEPDVDPGQDDDLPF